jgi:ABC-2 type transport system ATP-binding protein
MEGVHDLEVDGDRVTFQVDTARLSEVLGVLVEHGVRDLRSQPPTLEELFLRHYGDGSQTASAPGGNT